MSDHYILSREWRVIINQVQTNYHGRPVVLYSVRCDQAADYYEGSSLCMVGCVCVISVYHDYSGLVDIIIRLGGNYLKKIVADL